MVRGLFHTKVQSTLIHIYYAETQIFYPVWYFVDVFKIRSFYLPFTLHALILYVHDAAP